MKKAITNIKKEETETEQIKEHVDEGLLEQEHGQEQEQEYLPPNKVKIEYGQIAVTIESTDESTEAICTAAMQCMERLLGVGSNVEVPPTTDESEGDTSDDPIKEDDNDDLNSDREFKTLMDGIKA